MLEPQELKMLKLKLFEMLDKETMDSDDRRAHIWINAASLLVQLNNTAREEAIERFSNNLEEFVRVTKEGVDFERKKYEEEKERNKRLAEGR